MGLDWLFYPWTDNPLVFALCRFAVAAIIFQNGIMRLRARRWHTGFAVVIWAFAGYLQGFDVPSNPNAQVITAGTAIIWACQVWFFGRGIAVQMYLRMRAWRAVTADA